MLKRLIFDRNMSGQPVGSPDLSGQIWSSNNIPNLNYIYFSKWLIYYYEVWTKTKSKSILREYENFRRGIYPFDKQTINQFEDNILKYWGFVVPLAKELGYVIQQIFGICINTASVERLW
ncbi:unnamed protein product [Rhizophagus irregularis]|nr:unnamed protein product [Rhizophagus irregularis]